MVTAALASLSQTPRPLCRPTGREHPGLLAGSGRCRAGVPRDSQHRLLGPGLGLRPIPHSTLGRSRALRGAREAPTPGGTRLSPSCSSPAPTPLPQASLGCQTPTEVPASRGLPGPSEAAVAPGCSRWGHPSRSQSRGLSSGGFGVLMLCLQEMPGWKRGLCPPRGHRWGAGVPVPLRRGLLASLWGFP